MHPFTHWIQIVSNNYLARENNDDTPQTAQDSEGHSFEQDFSRLKVDESKSYYVNNALWVTLSNEVNPSIIACSIFSWLTSSVG